MFDANIVDHERVAELLVSIEKRKYSTGSALRYRLTIPFANDPTRYHLPPQKSPSIETAITTKELLDLAVVWNITASPAAFWKTHRNRDDLLATLQLRKHDMEMEAREAQKRLSGRTTSGFPTRGGAKIQPPEPHCSWNAL